MAYAIIRYTMADMERLRQHEVEDRERRLFLGRIKKYAIGGGVLATAGLVHGGYELIQEFKGKSNKARPLMIVFDAMAVVNGLLVSAGVLVRLIEERKKESELQGQSDQEQTTNPSNTGK